MEHPLLPLPWRKRIARWWYGVRFYPGHGAMVMFNRRWFDDGPVRAHLRAIGQRVGLWPN